MTLQATLAARRRTAVLVSGRGSNMAALIEAARDPAYPAEIVLVLSNRPDAGGLERAAAAGIATAVVDHKAHPSRESFEDAMQAALEAHVVELVCLAGFMRILTAGFIARWEDRLINIHPSLLPAFRGLHTHERALAEGVRLHGCTVHFVVPELDAGPIIAQGAVPVFDDDSADVLGARVLQVEHALYPLGLALVASGRARRDGLRVRVDGAKPQAPLISPLLV
ncbi:phosphoribosylglycinamide formyltransferase [Alsobacter metallidurans]|uniref:Phosphoribosylglycinamide formyltransferase n=1 Tax=Alsobacter metallidurans TaxID=340221 RepID=A0A917I7J4_9HYPH|nr:phosphoribosylglycinamide formyltransferase [Alsobacter metallidurans]